MGNFSRVSKKAKAKWRLTRLIGLIFLAAVMLPFVLGNSGVGFAWAIYFGVLFIQLLNLIIYPIIEYIQWSYLIDEDRIEIKKGIIWRTHTIIPISRIQHVAAASGPIQRLFKLATVSIHTAGGVHTICELSSDVAEEICGKLQNVVNIKVAQQLAAKQDDNAAPAAVSAEADAPAADTAPSAPAEAYAASSDGGDANC